MSIKPQPSRIDIAEYLTHLKASSTNPRAAEFEIPKHRRRPVPSPDNFKLKPDMPSEHDIQKSILVLLRRHPKVAKAIRYNSGTFRLSGLHGAPDRWFKANDCVGHSDIAGVLKGGRAFYIEVKRPGNSSKPGDAQDTFLTQMAFAGALAAEVSSVEQVIALLDAV